MKVIARYLVVVLIFGYSTLTSQETIWVPQAAEQLASEEERRVIPNKFTAFRADTNALRAQLLSSPHEREVRPNDSEQELTIPGPDGSWHTFKIVAYDLLAPELQEQWWYIRTWRGISTTNPMTTIRLDWTTRGFHAMIRGEEGSWFIDPLYWDRRDVYQVYHKNDYPRPERPFECHTVEDERQEHEAQQSAGRAGDCQFRQYRLALACTGEYADYHGGNVPDAASAMATTMNRVNGVYEADLAIRLVLVADNNDLIYLNPNTDPYSNGNGSAMLNQNQNNCDAVIGTANYDIGHVFSTGGGGVAFLNAPCRADRKAKGVTGQSNPVGDPFDIDYVAHEMGHQFGGNHTQNNACNRSSASMEPGSASTIMGYAGICEPNVQSNSDAYYHGVNIQEIANYMETGTGSTCATFIDMSNDGPSIVAGQDHTIPGDTPFVLTGNATDPNGDPLTYCWEQYDNEVGENMPPLASNTQGPMFRSFFPESSPERYFPRLSDLVNNVDPTWETLPGTNRDMDFRVTVRDYDGSYGCTTEDNVTVTVNANAGPFLVTNPNTNLTWLEGADVTVSWDVAGTANAPISCSNVDILLSYDGGFTYPTTLASSTANDGSQTITVPNGTTSSARVMVRCSNNIFFDISNEDFNISTGAAPDYTISYNGSTPEVCQGSSNSLDFVLNTTSIGGFSGPIDLVVADAPLGVNGTFSANPINPGDDVTVTVSNFSNLSAGIYTITVKSSSTVGQKIVAFDFEIIGPPSAPSLFSPIDGNVDTEIFPSFSWEAISDASDYLFELAEDLGFNNIVVSQLTTNTFLTPTTALDGESIYYWRVSSGNALCGIVKVSSIFNFETEACYNYSFAGNIIINSGAPGDYSSIINIPDGGTINDVDILNLNIDHSAVGDLRAEIESPAGSIRRLFDYGCGSSDDVLLSFDDDAGSLVSCPRNSGEKVRPEETLSPFNGQSMAGDWTLHIRDDATGNGGSINAWSVKVCTDNFGVLPVEWLTFTAKPVEQQIDLFWQTTAERDNAGFDIERRSAHETTFKPIAWMDAKDSPGTRNDYRYSDASVKPGLQYYYRLRQQDYSGEYAYSEIRAAKIDSELPQWAVYPNPLQEVLHLQVWNTNQEIEVTIFNSQGQEVRRLSLEAETLQQLQLGMLPDGMYWLQIRSGSWMESRRILKQ